MKAGLYRILGFYHLIAGAMLSLVIFIGAMITTKDIFFSHHVKLDKLSLGWTLLGLMLMLVFCIVAIKAGFLLLRKNFHGVRLALCVQLSQLVSLVTPYFVYCFHFPCFVGLSFFKSAAASTSQVAFMPMWPSQALFYTGAAKPVHRVWAALHYAVCVNLIALLCLLCFFILWLSEKRAASLSTNEQREVA